MSIVERIKNVIKHKKADEEIPAAAGNTAVVEAAPVIEAETVPDVPKAEKEYEIPVMAGEYLPWKGHIFKVTAVASMTFTAECVGITKNRATKLGVR